MNTIKGGLSDNKTISDIANSHNVSIDDIKVELRKGIKVEMEHTDDKRIALEIAMDHLMENPKYYTKLATIEKSENINAKKINETAFKDLLSQPHAYRIGSMFPTKTITDKKEIITNISDMITHNLFDYDFCSNWTNRSDCQTYKTMFKQFVHDPLMQKLDKTIGMFLSVKDSSYGGSPRKEVHWKLNLNDTESVIDGYFVSNKKFNGQLLKDYIEYRKRYAGVDLIKKYPKIKTKL